MPTTDIVLNVVTEQGDAPDRCFISITKARCIARYRMKAIPGRPEELVGIHFPQKTISFAYSGGELRIRKHGGERDRDWIEVRDFRLRDGWLSEVYDFLDDWLGYISPRDIKAPRPIQDNPQA
jgi:hypothetical protein